jgi:short-subunit dehydrogenase
MKKNALITGASGGIGGAISLKLAENGYNPVQSARDLSRLDELRKACECLGSVVEVLPAELTDEEEAIPCSGKRVRAICWSTMPKLNCLAPSRRFRSRMGGSPSR